MKFWKLMLIMALALGLFAFVACDDDDDDDDSTAPVVTIEDLVVGDWLCSGDGIPATVAAFEIDSAKVTFVDDQTLTLMQHTPDGGWTTLAGVWTITEEETGIIHTISIDYTGLVQEGIVEVVEGTPDVMRLEIVALGYGLDVPNPADGFGDGTNIQIYEKQ